ncbi:NUDIX domain-containing protein [Candidatus Falkowbacteria bacterium]|nr:NUDIX domain-containing protein [Candidatus Falkowbacteria bacterium]
MKHRNGAIIILYDEEKKVLLQHRTDDAPRRPGCWGFFGGGIEGEETPEEAVVRETKEELNYTLGKPKLMMDVEYKNEEALRSGTLHIFTEKCRDKSSLKLQEGQDMRWYSIEDAKKIETLSQLHIDILDFVKDKI